MKISHSGSLTHLALWLDGHEDVGEQRLWPQRAVEGDDSSQEGPEHHYNVYISDKTRDTRSSEPSKKNT